MLCTWGVNNGFVWDYAAAGPQGLTPLHLAALLCDGGRVAHQLAGQLLLLQPDCSQHCLSFLHALRQLLDNFMVMLSMLLWSCLMAHPLLVSC